MIAGADRSDTGGTLSGRQAGNRRQRRASLEGSRVLQEFEFTDDRSIGLQFVRQVRTLDDRGRGNPLAQIACKRTDVGECRRVG